ncbi:MAG: sulfide:quinone oxidoreductase [Solirubrobacteraceae bacterium]|jgi:sulfide:quinone oxidoreductase|nr:sulfide:quinone oxidoreductase [Solirubrobacteraceae bacterium]
MIDAPSHHVVIVGGGVAGLEAMLALRNLAPESARVTLIAPDEEFVYSPLSTGEPFSLTQVTRYSTARLAAEGGAQWHKDAVVSVDPGVGAVRTVNGEEHRYDSLLVALGAERQTALEPALTFADERSVPGYRDLLERLRSGQAHSVAFLVPRGVVWPFPLYELALMTGEVVRDEDLDVALTLVTPASAPLALFGRPAAEAMQSMLAERSVKVIAGNVPTRVTAPGRVLLEPDGYVLNADALVALPELRGPHLPGLPATSEGFIPVDEHARVRGLDDVYAAGDCTDFAIKQGGLAAQEADVAVGQIVARLEGRTVDPEPLVLRGVLLTGGERAYLHTSEREHADAVISGHALWWPPTKIAGRYLAPHLGMADERARLEREAADRGIEVEIPLHASGLRLHDIARELG